MQEVEYLEKIPKMESWGVKKNQYNRYIIGNPNGNATSMAFAGMVSSGISEGGNLATALGTTSTLDWYCRLSLVPPTPS